MRANHVAGGVFFLTVAIGTISVSRAFTIWTAVGAFGTVIFGSFALGEGLHVVIVFGSTAILPGIIGLWMAV